MANNHNSFIIGHQKSNQVSNSYIIKIVCWFVKKEDIGMLDQGVGQ